MKVVIKMKTEISKMLDKDKRVYEYSLMLNLAELEQLDELARSCKLNKASYIRSLIFNRLPTIVPQANIKLIADIGRVGSNLNQIARSLNSQNLQNADEVQTAINELRLALIGEKS